VLFLVDPLTRRAWCAGRCFAVKVWCRIDWDFPLRPLSLSRNWGALRSANSVGAAADEGFGGGYDCKSNASGTTPPYQAQLCIDSDGQCEVTQDGYYLLIGACTLLGLCWVQLLGPLLAELEALPVNYRGDTGAATKRASAGGGGDLHGSAWHVRSAERQALFTAATDDDAAGKAV
jgi:hypothetical protein